MKIPVLLLVAGASLALLGGCGTAAGPVSAPAQGPAGSSDTPAPAASIVLPTAPKKLTVTSAFADGKPIPDAYTCNGDSAIPPLAWSGDLAGGKALAVVVDDPDAPDGGFVHWIAFDLPTSLTKLAADKVPDGTKMAANSDGDDSWMAPCPPTGTHHYRFTVYALDAAIGLDEGVEPIEALKAIGTHAKAYGQLTGTVTAKS